jgi:PPOX class probable F420-dependent enzyme
MPRRRLTAKEAAFLRRERVIRLATAGPGGLHVVPVCHVLDRGAIYFGSDKKGRKVRNIARSPQVALIADRYSENWGRLKGVSIAGRAELVRDGREFEQARRLLYAKFPQYRRVAPLEPDDSVIVRVRPRRILSWDYAG